MYIYCVHHLVYLSLLLLYIFIYSFRVLTQAVLLHSPLTYRVIPLAIFFDISFLKIWNACNTETLFTLSGHTDTVKCCQFSPDTKKVVSASADNSFKVCFTEYRSCNSSGVYNYFRYRRGESKSLSALHEFHLPTDRQTLTYCLLHPCI